MNHNDYFQQALDRGDFIEAARIAISNGKRKSSRWRAWNWAEMAQEAAKKAGITLDVGHLSWPDFEIMAEQLEVAALMHHKRQS